MAWHCFRCLHGDSPTAACHKLHTSSFFTADNTQGLPDHAAKEAVLFAT